tara:strand:+ start:834 stop:1088 length:255 start_codon:yes stop_codon:yes gene_type:complete
MANRTKMLRGVSVEMSDEENAEFDALAVAAAKEAEDRAKVKYKADRKVEYPEIGDQLDDLYRKGAFSDEMAAQILAVKNKYPKP